MDDENLKKLAININSATLEDISDILYIEELSYGEHHWSRESFINEINNKLAHYYCARNEEGKLLGYIGFWIIFDEAHITTLAVTPEYRKNQVAQALLFKMFNICYEHEVKYITLEVRVSNTSAISLYEKNGFSSVGVRKNYYQDTNEDALIMFTENIWYEKFKMIYNQNKQSFNKIKIINE